MTSNEFSCSTTSSRNCSTWRRKSDQIETKSDGSRWYHQEIQTVSTGLGNRRLKLLLIIPHHDQFAGREHRTESDRLRKEMQNENQEEGLNWLVERQAVIGSQRMCKTKSMKIMLELQLLHHHNLLSVQMYFFF
ncbi:hypothetical protein CRE_20856 [Caenorhabditis remanei]|uniref:Uncharacterized protein n=1 Tax=Caenorhabditis remanei TaxID=31234 RepID=E3MV61_CAERE|nr:hypothetical protein CRE_20856 [Caenorhabditis remanei]